MGARPRRIILLCAAVVLAGAACGGDDDGRGGGGSQDAGSGRACVSGAEADSPTLLATPALDCSSRTCLHVEGSLSDQCTAACESPLDCVGSPESACDGDFVCVAPVSTGPFACEKFCVCESSVPEGGFGVECH